MTLKEYALDYARRGWQVFPLTDVVGGQCSCGKPCKSPGKHPRTTHGLSDATDDSTVIEKWWNFWPTANIGICTGYDSGFVVIDVDDPGLLIDVPDTVSQRTGSGGRHYLFKHPGTHVKTTVGVIPSVDSRGDGGYIVAPPSLHASGENYEWIDGPDDMDMADVPEWWLDALTKAKTKKKTDPAGEVVEGSRNTTVFDFGVGLWKGAMISESVLCAAMKEYNRTTCNPPLDDEEVEKTASSIARYDGRTQEQVEAEAIGEAALAAILRSHQRQVAESLVTKVTKEAGPPPKFMPDGGLIRDIAEYILSHSERPIEELAVAAATCFIGVLAGGRYQTPSRLGPNVLLIGLAESGSGKQKARSVISALAMDCGLYDFIGADDLASSAGLITEMVTHTNKLFMLDEFGLALSSITSKNAGSHKREIMSTIMKLYSSYGTVYHGTAYADQKARPKQVIKSPCLVIYGTSTHKTFYDALSSDQGADGFISRLLVIPTGEDRPERRRPKYPPVPGRLKASIIGYSGFQHEDGKMTVPMDQQIDDAFFDLDESMTELMDDATENKEQARSVYSRVAEKAANLALIYAISYNYLNPVIDHKAFCWGREIALWCANHIMEKMAENVGDNDNERTAKRMISLVKKEGAKGIDRRTLQRRFLGMKAHERDELIQDLVMVGHVFQEGKRLVHSNFWREEKEE